LERFCAGVCDALAKAEPGPEGKPAAADLSGLEFIQTLQARNLFAIALDDPGRMVSLPPSVW
jgi:hypothetical protein